MLGCLQMLIGLCGAELVPKSAVGASQGVLGLVAYMGAANAGIPLAYVLKHHGWEVGSNHVYGSSVAQSYNLRMGRVLSMGWRIHWS